MTIEDFHPVWKRVHAAFQAWAGVTSDKVERVQTSIKLQSENLWNQAVGCTITALQRAAYSLDTNVAGWEDRFYQSRGSGPPKNAKTSRFSQAVEDEAGLAEVSIPPSILHPFKRMANCVVGVTHHNHGQIRTVRRFADRLRPPARPKQVGKRRQGLNKHANTRPLGGALKGGPTCSQHKPRETWLNHVAEIIMAYYLNERSGYTHPIGCRAAFRKVTGDRPRRGRRAKAQTAYTRYSFHPPLTTR